MAVFAVVFGLLVVALGAFYLWLSTRPDHPMAVSMRKGPFMRFTFGFRWTGILLVVLGAVILFEWLVVLR
jgi:hypothetical protein